VPESTDRASTARRAVAASRRGEASVTNKAEARDPIVGGGTWAQPELVVSQPKLNRAARWCDRGKALLDTARTLLGAATRGEQRVL